MKKLYLLACGLCAFALMSCTEVSLEGYVPVYETYENYQAIYSEAPRSMADPGKIYYKDNLIFVIERDKGIHVVDNENPEDPQILHFIHMRGSSDISIKDNNLYSNNGPDLVVLDISDLGDVKVTGRIANAFESAKVFTSNEPPVQGVAFECVDHSKGMVIDWERKELTNPECSN